MNKTLLGLASLVLLGVLLTACAPAAGTDTGDDQNDQVTKPESVEITLYVGPLLVDCEGEGPQKCMLVKEKPEDEYMLFYDQVEGF
jgi:hypothetical protein